MKKNIKTFDLVQDEEKYVCCLIKYGNNDISIYCQDDGCWESYVDATITPGGNDAILRQLYPADAGYVFIDMDAGILDTLVYMEVVHAPLQYIPIGQGYKKVAVCEVNLDKLNEWDASPVLFAEA